MIPRAERATLARELATRARRVLRRSDGAHATFVRQVATADRPSTCVECHRYIDRGEEFELWGTPGEPSLISWARCLACAAWASLFLDVQHGFVDGEWELGGLWETIATYLESARPAEETP